MIGLIIKWFVNTAILILISYVFPTGVIFDNFYSALIAALILGIINALIRPIILILTLPINILTLGLFTLFINGAMFWLSSTFVKGFYVSGFWTAFWAALIFSAISTLLSWIDNKLTNK